MVWYGMVIVDLGRNDRSKSVDALSSGLYAGRDDLKLVEVTGVHKRVGKWKYDM